MKIIKRDGREEIFDINKVKNAIRGANQDLDQKGMHKDTLRAEGIDYIASIIESWAQDLGHTPSVEEVQNQVHNLLAEIGRYELARQYEAYRTEHKVARENDTLYKRIIAITGGLSEEAKQENSNKNPTIMSTQRDYMAGEVSKDISRKHLLTPEIVTAHDEGIIHVHDMDYYAQPMTNCFKGSTKLVTDQGLVRFDSLHDGQKITVIDMNGDLREATVHTYGKQPMNDITLKAGRRTMHVFATANHRWILNDGSITTNLSVGDRLIATPTRKDVLIDTPAKAKLFALGFALGDGNDRHNPTESTIVYLCGNKIRYASIFELAGWTEQKSTIPNSIKMYIGTALKQDFLNSRAWRYLDANQLRIVFQGYYAADGATDRNSIATTSETLCDFIEYASGLAGYHISSKKTEIRNTNFKDNAQLTTYHFICNQPNNHLWRVKSIKPYRNNNPKVAWCVEEPITHSFTLEGGIVTGNCCLVNLDDMLNNGTVITNTLIERPHTFSTACTITTQVVAQVSSGQFGGQTINLAHISQFVQASREKFTKDVLKEAEATGITYTDEQLKTIVESRVRDDVKKGVQTIQYQLITLLTTNGQAPFVTLGWWLNEVPAGQARDDLALCIEEVLLQRYEGTKDETGHWITPAFPKLIFVLDEDSFDTNSKYYYLTELAAKCTAKRMVPDYVSAKMMRKLKLSKGETEGHGDVYVPMGCRSFLTPDRSGNGCGNIAHAKNWEPNKPKYWGRFNVGVTTINLVDVALSSAGDIDEFWRIFEKRLELCHTSLKMRYERLSEVTSDVAPILWQYGALARLGKHERIYPLFFGGNATISLGYAGLYECVKYMTGVSHTDHAHGGHGFGIAIMQYMNDKCAEWKAAENIDYSIYGTPIESTTYKFAKCLQRRFGIIPDITDHGYITNSYHVNVREEIDAFEKLAFESEFQHLSPGGAISYVEVPNMQDNLDAVITVMRFIYDHIIYAELNTKSDLCEICGYDGEIKTVVDDGKLVWECPNCGNRDQAKMSVVRRTCGYLGSQFWNQGRTEEIRDRVMHL